MADGPGHVFGPGPAVALLRAALLLGQHVRAVADEQRADALGPLELVGGDRQQVDVERGQVDRQVRRRLDRVGVEKDALVAPDPGRDLGDRLDRARPRCWRASR